MSRYYISLWYLLPPGPAQELPEGAQQVAEEMFDTYGKGEMDLSSRSGYVDYALSEFARHVDLGALRRLMDPEQADWQQFRFETYRGAELQELSDAIQHLLGWARANADAACATLRDDPAEDVRQALFGEAIERGSLASHPRIPFSDDGQGPHVLFTYLRTVRELAERAKAQGALLLQLKSRG